MPRFDNRERWPSRLAKTLTATVAIAAVVAFAAMAATARNATQPANTSPPTISGNATVGSTLTANNGNWTGTSPITYSYQWRRCDASGGSCSDISGATQQTYSLASVDNGNTLRVVVTGKNSDGSDTATTVPTAVVTATPSTGCPSAAAGATVAVGDVSPPARLVVDQFTPTPSTIPGNFSSFTLKVRVTDTCGQPVSGAAVYASAVPFNQVNIPAETNTGSDGTVTLTFSRLRGFPASRQQELMVMYIRARMPHQNPLTGITGLRVVSFPVNLNASS